MGAFAVREPGAGSDVSIRTRAVRDGDDWVLNGQKVFITNGGIASLHVVMATVDPGPPRPGQLRDPARHPGLRQGKKKKLGIAPPTPPRCCWRTCRVPMTACSEEERLQAKQARDPAARPRARVPGPRGRASGALATFEATRPIVSAQAVGIARAAFEYAATTPASGSSSRQADRRPAGHRLQAGRHGHRDRRRPPPGLARLLDGPQRRLGFSHAEAPYPSSRPARSPPRLRRGHPDPRRLRLHPRLPCGEVAPAT